MKRTNRGDSKDEANDEANVRETDMILLILMATDVLYVFKAFALTFFKLQSPPQRRFLALSLTIHPT